jgi:cysteinyl-tRNA synthetase
MHHGMVLDQSGEKMSKSLDNYENLLDVIEQYDGRAYRMALLQSHYRQPVKVGAGVLAAAANTVAGLDAFAARTASVEPLPREQADAEVLERFRAAMDDDLDTPRAMALLFDTVRRANTLLDAGDSAAARPLVAAVREIADAVGLELGGTAEVPTDVAARAAALDDARGAKDYATADEIRATLQADGWIVETTPAGTIVRR